MSAADIVPMRAPELVEVTAVGLGYRGTIEGRGIVLTLGRVRENRGDLGGELTVVMGGAHLHKAHFNVSVLGGRKTLAGYLSARTTGTSPGWQDILEQFCMQVLDLHHAGEPFERVGARPIQEGGHPYLLHPLLPENAATIIFGPGGTGKSTLAAGIAMSVQSGVEIVRGWVPTQANVLVLDWEARSSEWNDRLVRIAAGLGIDPVDLHYRTMVRPLAEQVDEMATFRQENEIGLIVVDSVGMAMGGSREGSDAADGALRLFAALRSISGTHVLIDHVPGDDTQIEKTTTSRPYGSVFKQNLARQVWQLRREREAGGNELLLINTKANDESRLPPMGLAVDQDRETIRFCQKDVESPELVDTLPGPIRMKRLLAKEGALPPKHVAQELDPPDATVRSWIKRDRDKAQREGKPGLFVILDNGKVGLADYA